MQTNSSRLWACLLPVVLTIAAGATAQQEEAAPMLAPPGQESAGLPPITAPGPGEEGQVAAPGQQPAAQQQATQQQAGGKFVMTPASLRANEAFAALREGNLNKAMQLYQSAGNRYQHMVERIQQLKQDYESGRNAARIRLPEDNRIPREYWLGWREPELRSEQQITIDRAIHQMRTSPRHHSGMVGTYTRAKEKVLRDMPGYSNLGAQEMLNAMP